MAGQTEGVIKYHLDFTPGPSLPRETLAELIAWQRIVHRLGLLGRDPARYGGLAYGNLSRRLADGGFAISASQTGDRDAPTPADYARVDAWDCAHNRIVAGGPAKPSSESLTHAALYDADPAIGCVLHVHSPVIWENRKRLGLAGTAADVAYGTPAMAAEVARLYSESGLAGHGVLAMGGHQDGVLSFGPDPDGAGGEMMLLLRRALSLD
jgi:hypothetical protein